MKYKIFLLLTLIITSSFAQNKNKTIGFKENKGQIINQNGKPNDAVKYLLNSSGLNVQIKTNGFSYDIYETKKNPLTEKQKAKIHPSLQPEKNKEVIPDYSLEHIYHRIDIDFMNSNPNVELIKEEKSKDYDNFYNVPNKPNGVLKVYRYQQITYKNIYPNIDVVFTVPKDTSKTVEYNFVIQPKGKISDIQLKFRGAETALVDNKIRMSVRFGEMEETLPASWTEAGEVKKEIAVGYKKIKKNVYGFESAENVSGKTVVIDPVPIRLWGTYYGGEMGETPTSLFCKENHTYLTGTTTSKENIASTGAHQFNYASIGGFDSFLVKFNPNGTRIWSTYYGGEKSDIIFQVKVSNNHNIYIVGETLSDNNISTSNSFEPDFNSIIQDGRQKLPGFLVKFDENGERKWGTYYWGSISNLSIDSSEKIYISGTTIANKKISTTNAHQINLTNPNLNPVFGYLTEGFIAKFNSDGEREWGTYYGGSNDEYITDSQLDSNGFLYVLGITSSSNNISTINITNSPSHSNADSFLVKFDKNGNRMWGNYYGGEKNDYAYSLGIDSNNYLYTFGWTQSLLNISTPGVFQETYNNSGHLFPYNGCIFKINSEGEKIWGTYFFSETLKGTVSKNGDLYFTGTNSVNNPKISTPNAYQEDNNGWGQAYLVCFDKNAKRKWGTFYGGSNGGSNGNITATDDNGYIYLAGTTTSSNYIATPNTHQTRIYNSDQDTYLVKFQDCLSNHSITSNSPICLSSTLELKASGGTNYSWTGPNGFTSSLQNPTITNATAINSGKYFCTITGTGGCDDTKSIEVFVGDADAPIPNLTTLPTISGDCHTSITTTPTASDACAGTITATSTSPLSYNLPGTYTIVWNYQDGNGNSVTQEQKVIINAQPLPVSTSPQTFCIQQNATLNSITITGQNVKWYDALTNGNLLDNSSSLQSGITYYASQTINGCESERTAVLINIQNTPTPITNTNQTFCSNQNPTIDAIQVTGTNIKWYDASNNGSSIAATTNLINGTTYYVTQTINNCESLRLGITVSIVNTPPSPTANAFQSFCKNENASLSTIQITGQNIKWYDSSISTVTLPNDRLLVNNTTYYASQTIGCESSRIPILIRIQETPLPLGKSNQQFCIDENPLLSNLTISGTAIKWYDAQVGGNLLSNTTTLQNGKTYFATQTINDCESERLAVTSIIQDSTPPTAEAIQSFCVQKNAKISDISILGQNINWFDSLTSSTSLSESTLLTNGITYYASQTINNCESTRIPILITILDATNDECINLVDELPYPKFFTPNNDGFNDTWTIDFNYLEPNSSIRIFDRYGKLVKELRNNDSWDGTYLGHILPATDYWFTVTRKNGSEFKSHFSLKR
nr:T9SS type B sorting domain-containing protein [uncultured Flavobacterium sp.]